MLVVCVYFEFRFLYDNEERERIVFGDISCEFFFFNYLINSRICFFVKG